MKDGGHLVISDPAATFRRSLIRWAAGRRGMAQRGKLYSDPVLPEKANPNVLPFVIVDFLLVFFWNLQLTFEKLPTWQSYVTT